MILKLSPPIEVNKVPRGILSQVHIVEMQGEDPLVSCRRMARAERSRAGKGIPTRKTDP